MNYNRNAAAYVDNLREEYGGGRAALKLVAGGVYKTRDGRKVGPIAVTRYANGSGNSSWPFTVGLKDFWTESGKACWSNSGGEFSSQIVAEWTDEPAATGGAKFKVDDRVKQKHWADKDWSTVTGFDGVTLTIRDDNGFTGEYDNLRDFETKPTSIADIVARHSQTGTAIVCLLENGKPKPSIAPFVHGDAKAASTEASRLANVHKGKEFGVYTLGEVKKVERTFAHEWQRLAYAGRKIEAIRELRGKTGLFLATAKDAVEDWLKREAA
jgi:hypothetical protein